MRSTAFAPKKFTNAQPPYRGIEHIHRLLHRALEHAVEQGELPSNPTHYAKLPKPDVKAEITCAEDEDEGSEVEYLALEQAKRFREAARKDRWPALWLLLLDAGLRPGEALALQWRHIDFDRQMMKVRGSLARVRNEQREERGKGWIITKPKTKSSIGDVPVRTETIKALREWKVEQAKQRLLIGPEWQDHGFVFTTEFGTPLGNNIRRAWMQVMREADGGRGDLGAWGPEVTKPRSGPTPQRSFTPRFSPYVLRHTCATLLLLGGMDLLQVSRRLRHKNIAITARFYGHVKAKHTTQALEIWDRLFASTGS
jgi:integrase